MKKMLVVVAICVCCFFIPSFFYGVHINSIGLFLIYCLVYIQIPGYLIIKSLNITYASKGEDLLISFFVGIFLIIVEYFFLSFIDCIFIIKYINVIVSTACVIYYIPNILRNKNHIKLVKPSWKTILFISFLFIMCSLYLQYQYVSPELTEYIDVERDQLWHMGNINMLVTHYPVVDARIADHLFFYHYFQELFFAIFSLIFKVPADVIIFTCSPFLLGYIISISLIAFFKAFGLNPRRVQLYSFIFILLSFASVGVLIDGADLFRSLFNEHIFSNISSVAFSISAILAFMVALKRIRTVREICVSMMIMAVATGIKGPVTIVVVAAMICAFIIDLIVCQKINYINLLSTILNTVTFLFIYMFIISGVNTGNAPKGSNLEMSIFATIERGAVFKFLCEISFFTELPSLIQAVFSIIIEMILIIGTIIIPYIVYCAIFTKSLLCKKEQWIDIVIVLATIIGIGGFLIVDQSGFSQGYFLFAVIPFIFLLAIKAFELEEKKIINTRHVMTISIAIGVAIGFCCFMNTNMKMVNAALDKAMGNIEYSNKYSILSKKEYNGYIWLRNNTNEDSIIATDRRNLLNENQYIMSDGVYYYASAYSQRAMYLEGYAYSSITDEEFEDKIMVLKQIYDKCIFRQLRPTVTEK